MLFLCRKRKNSRQTGEVEQRTKVVEVFCREEALGKLLCLILGCLNEVWGGEGSGDLRKSFASKVD